MKFQKMLGCIITTAMLVTMSTGVCAVGSENALQKYDITIANTEPITLSPEENVMLLGYLDYSSPNSPFVSRLSTRSQVVLSPEEFFQLLVDIDAADQEFLNNKRGKIIEIENPHGLGALKEVSKEDYEKEYQNDKVRASYTRTNSGTFVCMSCVYKSTIQLTSNFSNGSDSVGAYQDNTSNSKSNTAASGQWKRLKLSNESIYSDGRTYQSGDVSRAIYDFGCSCDHDTHSKTLSNQSNPVR